MKTASRIVAIFCVGSARRASSYLQNGNILSITAYYGCWGYLDCQLNYRRKSESARINKGGAVPKRQTGLL